MKHLPAFAGVKVEIRFASFFSYNDLERKVQITMGIRSK